MIKKSLLIILLLLIIPIFIHSAIAADSFDIKDSKEFETAEKVKDTADALSEEDIRSEYLSRQWTDFLEKNNYLNWIYKLNPVFKFFLSQEFSLSWVFFGALIIFLGVLFFYQPIINTFIEDEISSIFVSLLIATITTNLATDRILALGAKVALGAWSATIFTLFLLVFFFIIVRISRIIKIKIRKAERKRKLEKLEDAAENSVDLKKFTEGFESQRDGGSMNKYKK